MKAFPKIKKLHEETQNTFFHVPAGGDRIEYKAYPRFEQCRLPKPQELNRALSETLFARESEREFDKDIKLTLQKIGDFLYWSGGLQNRKRKSDFCGRFYPSAGGRFPLEIYISCSGEDELAPGVYHYNVYDHTLEKLLDKSGDAEIRSLKTYPFVKDAKLIVIITSIFDRQMRKYNERGYRFSLIESGSLMQNMYLVSTALNLKICAIGSSLDKEIEEVLDLESTDELVLSYCVVGK